MAITGCFIGLPRLRFIAGDWMTLIPGFSYFQEKTMLRRSSCSIVITSAMPALASPECNFKLTLWNCLKNAFWAISRPENGIERRFLSWKFKYHFLVKILRTKLCILIADLFSISRKFFKVNPTLLPIRTLWLLLKKLLYNNESGAFYSIFNWFLR